MSEDNQPDLKQLEVMTNELEGIETIPEVETSPEPVAQPPAVEAEPSQPTPEPIVPGQSDISGELKKVLGDSPYVGEDVVESVRKLAEGYKNLQSQYTKVNEKVKPREQLLKELDTDPKLAETVNQLLTLYKNPAMAEAYKLQTGQTEVRPNPVNYNVVNPQDGQTYFDQARYEADVDKYMARQLDTRLNARFAELDQQRKIERMKSDFKQAFPDVDPDLAHTEAMKKTDWTLVDAWKALKYDEAISGLRSKTEAEVRKEITKQLEEASKSKTPVSSSTPQTKTSPAEIVQYMAKYGTKKAFEKYGKENAESAAREFSED
jgi:hypothetical protein